MKPIVLVIACLIVVATIRVISQPNLPEMEFLSNTTMPANLHVIMKTTVTDPPEEGIVYQVKIKDYSDDDVKVLAKSFGLDQYITYNNDSNEWLAYQNGELLIVDGGSGTWIYRNITANQKKYNTNEAIPDDKEAVALAKEYITKLDIDAGNLNITAVAATVEAEKILQKSVHFYQDLAGHELMGAPQVMVDIGANGQLEGITNLYYELQDYGTFEFKNIEQVITELQSQQAQYNGSETVLSDAAIYEVSLAYCQSVDVSGQQAFLVPVFLFSGKAETQSGPTPFCAWVPAVKGLAISNEIQY